MSLRIWLPLNGDLRQLGISNAVATNDGATIDNNGKIGKCYSFNNTHIIVDSTDLQDILSSTTQPFSMACWIYLNSDETDRVIIFGNYSANPFVNWELLANCTQRLCAGGTSNFTNRANSTVVPKTTWTHIAVTYDGTTTTFYQNGASVGSVAGANTLTTKTASSRFYLGSDVRNDATRLKGKMNDFRFYDHCLSAAEVREIAQGLILHYKLDSIGFLRGSENFILESHQVTSGGNASGITRTYMEDGSLKIIAASGNGNYASIGFAKNSNDNVGAKLTVGDTYTLSCDIKVESGTTLPTIFINSGNGYKRLQGNFTLGQWIQVYYTSTWADPGTGYGNISLHLGFSGLVGTYYFKNFKLEKSSTPTAWCPSPLDDNYNSYMPTSVFDSSGYNNNAISNGSQPITIDSDTSRYSMSTKFVSGSRIAMPVASSTCLPTDAITVNIWVKSSNLANRFLSCTEGGGWNFEIYNNSYIRVPIYISGKGYTYCNTNTSWSSISDNQWHMLSFTYDKQVEKIYLDGEMILSSTSSYPGINIGYSTSTPLTLGAEAQTIASPIAGTYVGNLSDLRIYCTPLLDTDIKQLYNVGMKIDKLGNIHSFELEENIGMVSNVKFVNNSANSVTYDATTDTYTIVSKADTSSWGYGVRLADDPPLWVPYGATYRWTAEVWTPIALNVNTDYNNTTGSADTNWAGNDNDATGTRLAAGVSIPANTWTRIYRGASNTNNGNTNHLPIRDYSSLGLVTNGQSEPVTWKVRHLQWYLIDTNFKPQLKKTGIFKSSHFTETETDLNKPAQFSKKMFSVNANQFIER